MFGRSLLESIGSNVEGRTDGIEAIFKDSGLDWTVEQDIVQSPILGEIPNTLVNYRSDNKQILGLVSKSHYKIVNNIEAFKFIDDLPDFSICKVGMANMGKQVFVVGKSSDRIEIDKEDYVDQYLTFVHGHDGKRGVALIISPIRMYCTNQLNIMLHNADFKYSIKHSGNVEKKLSVVKKALTLNKEYMLELGNELRSLTTAKASMSIDDFLDKLLPVNENESTTDDIKNYNTKGAIREIYNNKVDNQNYKDSYFGYLNAVSDYISHSTPGRNMKYTRENMFLETIQNNKLLNEAYTILKAA